MKLIFGLGNPGKEYEMTRHNMGFMALDALAEKYGISVRELKFKAIIGKGMIEGEKVILLKPLTHMNLSGESVRAAMDFYKAASEDVIIMYDDIDLDPGQLRIRAKGSAGSHNGMKSVIAHMGSTVFPRVRIGVGAKPEGWDLADYVLARPRGADLVSVKEGIAKAAEAVGVMIKSGVSEAMNIYNAKLSDKIS